MPTGYTSQIEQGISFRQFALSCARNFGAAIALRDEDSSVLPNEENVKFKSSYSEKSLEQALAEKDEFLNLSASQIKQKFLDWKEQSIARNHVILAQKRVLRQKYESMLAEVKNWTPPTGEHENMKSFMVSQIEESIRYDCGEDYYLEAIETAKNTHQAEFYWEKIREFEWSIQYHSKQLNEDSNRDTQRSNWIKELINSLPKD